MQLLLVFFLLSTLSAQTPVLDSIITVRKLGGDKKLKRVEDWSWSEDRKTANVAIAATGYLEGELRLVARKTIAYYDTTGQIRYSSEELIKGGRVDSVAYQYSSTGGSRGYRKYRKEPGREHQLEREIVHDKSDAQGRILRMRALYYQDDTLAKKSVYRHGYNFDEQGRLTTDTIYILQEDGTEQPNKLGEYTYDEEGRRQAKTKYIYQEKWQDFALATQQTYSYQTGKMIEVSRDMRKGAGGNRQKASITVTHYLKDTQLPLLVRKYRGSVAEDTLWTEIRYVYFKVAKRE